MARKKQHPDIGKFKAMFEHVEHAPGDAPDMFDTLDEAIADHTEFNPDDGDVMYVYQLVDVRVVRKPTLTVAYVPEVEA